MSLQVISLKNLLKSTATEEEIKTLLLSFVSIRSDDNDERHDVEYFLHDKAIEFEKHDLSRTYLVMTSYKAAPVLAGYFSISNKPLVIAKRNFTKFSVSLRKRLYGVGHKTIRDNYECKGYLLGQLGKNYSEEAKKAGSLTGRDILKLANDAMLVSYNAVGGRIFYLECEDIPKLKEFYDKEGFKEIQGYRSPNDYCLMVRKIEG